MYPLKLEPGKCQTYIPTPGCRMGVHQRTRKCVRDGFCNTHHPDSVRERQKKSMEEYDKKLQNSPLKRLWDANQRIKELEAEIERLKKRKN